jgi:hypothetical protein
MGTKIIRVAAVILLYLTTTYATCSKDCIETTYFFEAGIKVYPDTDSININDTIWLEAGFSSLLKDLQTGSNVDYRNTENLGTGIQLLRFTGGSLSDPGVVPAIDSFTFLLKEGVLMPPNGNANQVKTYNFLEESGKYKFKLGVIPQKKGVYALAISNAANVFQKNDKCTKASFAFKLQDTDNHIYLLKENRPDYTPSGLELTNLYCFKVK